MQTHDDRDHGANELNPVVAELLGNAESQLDELRKRADAMVESGASQIASDGIDHPILNWSKFGVDVRKLGDDDLGLLRVSIGGGKLRTQPGGPLQTFRYLTYRGSREQVLGLLQRAVRALEAAPPEAMDYERFDEERKRKAALTARMRANMDALHGRLVEEQQLHLSEPAGAEGEQS